MIVSGIHLVSGRILDGTIMFSRAYIVSDQNDTRVLILDETVGCNNVYISNTQKLKQFSKMSLLKSLTLEYIRFSYTTKGFTIKTLENKIKESGITILQTIDYDK